jgi:hypothetical protein
MIFSPLDQNANQTFLKKIWHSPLPKKEEGGAGKGRTCQLRLGRG